MLYQSRGVDPRRRVHHSAGARPAGGEGDVTIVAYSRMAREAEKAASILAEEGIGAEVIDLRSLVPLDIDAVVASVTKTGRVVLVERAPAPAASARSWGCASSRRRGIPRCPDSTGDGARHPIPFAPELEAAVIPRRPTSPRRRAPWRRVDANARFRHRPQLQQARYTGAAWRASSPATAPAWRSSWWTRALPTAPVSGWSALPPRARCRSARC